MGKEGCCVGRVLPGVAGFAEKRFEHRNLGDATTRYCCKGYLQSTPSQKWVRAYFLSYIKIIQLALNKFPAFEAQKGGAVPIFFQDIIGGYRGNFATLPDNGG
jgi:hypothetical protein